ncbi:hypothetical protein EZ054_04845 [Enterococcus faecalis]|uniref:hypothetical protein n=1 Tax=Enterococcus faecalis TaxID=1351 RepID=UPI001143E939|nr:hypothetical protein [Enterococcus faecalis]MBP4075301.1 hypothetical protein [Enterococcus faecalis]MBP4093409.1 hypothetical protein [Enterococcus faecalis]MUN82243.1 hypothetical protein [Enterococcus faecalis]NGG30019.1 hypothetical protein [Enterococcus faecalis]NSV60701.1 hypothetical protein [Enterococcus faecalis]
MKNLKYSKDFIEWIFKNKKIKIPINNIILASEDEQNDYIIIETGENFISSKIYYYDFSGNQLLFCDKKEGLIVWNVDGSQHSLEFSGILNIGFFLKKKVIAIMYLASEKEAMIFDLKGNFICEVEKLPHYEMMYFQEYPDYISIVMEGDNETEDKYRRSIKNFHLNILTGTLQEMGLSY